MPPKGAGDALPSGSGCWTLLKSWYLDGAVSGNCVETRLMWKDDKDHGHQVERLLHELWGITILGKAINQRLSLDHDSQSAQWLSESQHPVLDPSSHQKTSCCNPEWCRIMQHPLKSPFHPFQTSLIHAPSEHQHPHFGNWCPGFPIHQREHHADPWQQDMCQKNAKNLEHDAVPIHLFRTARHGGCHLWVPSALNILHW